MSKNFGDIPKEYCNRNNARIVILPVPYDGTSTWMKGADKGPAAIIEASAHMELYDIDTDSEVYKQGIFTDSPVTEKSSPEMVAKAVRERVAEYLRDGTCSSSTLKEASSLGKVNASEGFEQMVYAEATSVLPLIISYVYYKGDWKNRKRRNWSEIFK
jgi:arginase family enzyme